MSEARILILDDEASIRSSLSSFLSDLGYEAVTACNGEEGISIVENERIDLAFVDLRMPQVSGIEFLEYVEESKRILPTVVISGADDINLAIESLRRGAWDYLTKPICNVDIIDVTIKRLLERARLIRVEREYHINLEREVEKQTRELEEAKNQAESANRLKTSLLLNMSHEVRTPINGILSFIELLEEDSCTEEDRSQYHQVVKDSSLRMLRLLSNIIDISKIETGIIDLKHDHVSVGGLIRESVDSLRPMAKKKGLEVSCSSKSSDDPIVILDNIKLSQVITNLVQNAIKFTDTGSIEVSSRWRRGSMSIEVADTGTGIPEQEQELVFERFRQGSVGTGSREGLGLGLSICRSYVNAMNGSISIRSAIGDGTTFTVEIPCEAVESRKEIAKPPPSRKTGHTVLLADDDESIRLYLSTILRKAGHEVIVANDGQAAVRIVRNTPEIEVVVMDLKMPMMDGEEATREIMKIRSGLPIIGQSAYTPELDLRKMASKGFATILPKPINKKELLKLIGELLEAHSTE